MISGGLEPTISGLQGMNRAGDAANKAAENIASGSLEPKDVVDLKLAETAFAANAKMARIGSDMQKQLLDILT